MLTLTKTPTVIFYLRCMSESCQHRYESDRTDTLCPVCLSQAHVYGVKVDEPPTWSN